MLLKAGSLEPPRCWDIVHRRPVLIAAVYNTSAFPAAAQPLPGRSAVSSTEVPPHNFTMKNPLLLLLLVAAAFTCGLAQNPAEELSVETVERPETCSVQSRMGDTLQIHYTGRLMDGKVIDTSLSRDPLVVELGKRTVIPGLEQSLVGVCEGQKIKATIPPHLAYGKKGYPPTIPGDAALEFEVEVISLSQQTPLQKMINDVFPLVCLALVPTLLGLVGLYLYKKSSAQKPNKKKPKDKKSKKK
ncbi:hypothetical protein OJAV_G00048650 [Oryzias javanicus]|uniref:peptidylprolyl isomerase n=1 Tax=Oryzias javanicus TaxID=123683 RepID=A0A3S2Q842_ORYJA|nr:hypothetical protein OJAV_G00048650 [Oryzias javanicus]